jgi:hypothetical protein
MSILAGWNRRESFLTEIFHLAGTEWSHSFLPEIF